jgi:hypothetical protein
MADTPHRKFYALIADPQARPTYPPSFEDPQAPVTPIGGGGDGAETFLELTDTPSTYTGQSAKKVVVKGDETGLEFVTDSGGGNFVSYDVDDAKNATEQLRARTNIGSAIGIATTNSVDSTQDNLARPTNFIVFTGGTEVRSLTGLVAGTDGEEVILWNRRSFNLRLTHDATSTAANRFSLPDSVLFDINPNEIVLVKYNASISRWVLVNDGKFLRRDRADSRVGTLTQNGETFIVHSSNQDALRITQNLSAGRCLSLRKPGASSSDMVRFINNIDTTPVTMFRITDNGLAFFILSPRSEARSAHETALTRRDELYLNYNQTVTTTGIINNLDINSDTQLLTLTQADELTGVVPVTTTLGRELKIYTSKSGGVIIRHENASSTAANRFSLPGAADITINNGEAYMFIYISGRWRRCL